MPLPTIDLGKIRMTYKGVYDPAATYEFNDVATYGGNTYVYVYATAQAGRNPSTALAYWLMLHEGTRFRGAFAVGMELFVGDVVYAGGSLYRALKDHTSASAVADEQAGKLGVILQGAPLPAAGQNGKIVGVVGGAYVLIDNRPIVITGDTTAVDGATYVIDYPATKRSYTITLPANPVPGTCIEVQDGANMLQSYPVNVARNGSLIHGVSDDVHLNVNGISISFTYVNATIGWRIN